MRKGWAVLLLAALLVLGLVGARRGIADITGHPGPPMITLDLEPPMKLTVLGEVVRVSLPTRWPWER